MYFQPEAPDPVLADDVVLSLVRRHVPGATAVRSVDESGGEARTYAVDADVILKVQRPMQLRTGTSLEREAVFLRHLAQADPGVPVPRILGHGWSGPMVEYTVLTRMPGSAMRRVTLDRAAREGVLTALGATLRRIHRVPQDPLADSDLFPGDRGLPDLQGRMGEAFAGIAERLGRSRHPWTFPEPLEAIGSAVMRSMPRGEARVALHSNPGPEHAFIDPDGGRFRGLIDFGDAYISHPALDLRRWAGPGDRDAIFAGYTAREPVTPGFLAVWRAVCMLWDASAIAAGGDAAAVATDLRQLLGEISGRGI